MKNPIKMDDLGVPWGTIIFGNIHYIEIHHFFGGVPYLVFGVFVVVLVHVSDVIGKTSNLLDSQTDGLTSRSPTSW